MERESVYRGTSRPPRAARKVVEANNSRRYRAHTKEAQQLAQGMVGVIPTDTLYGLVASAHNVAAVERVYALKNRDATKSCIVLIDSMERLSEFGIELTDTVRSQLVQFWPGPVSVVIPVTATTHAHVVRGNGSIAFRLPSDERVLELLRVSGPLIAPSANPEGLSPATTIDEAREYFGAAVDVYIDGGVREGAPSRLISVLSDGTVVTLRAGK